MINAPDYNNNSNTTGSNLVLYYTFSYRNCVIICFFSASAVCLICYCFTESRLIE